MVYGVPTMANKPMVLRSTPTSAIQNSRVEPDRASGRPEEKPRKKTTKTRGFRYTAALPGTWASLVLAPARCRGRRS